MPLNSILTCFNQTLAIWKLKEIFVQTGMIFFLVHANFLQLYVTHIPPLKQEKILTE